MVSGHCAWRVVSSHARARAQRVWDVHAVHGTRCVMRGACVACSTQHAVPRLSECAARTPVSCDTCSRHSPRAARKPARTRGASILRPPPAAPVAAPAQRSAQPGRGRRKCEALTVATLAGSFDSEHLHGQRKPQQCDVYYHPCRMNIAPSWALTRISLPSHTRPPRKGRAVPVCAKSTTAKQ